MQPLNGRVLVRLAESQYKHVSLNTDKQHQNAISEGVIIALPNDLWFLVRKHLKYTDGDYPEVKEQKAIPDLKPGDKIRWDKFAEQNNTFDYTGPKSGETFKAALIKYEDITAYEPKS
jgi:hypothetical protein